jgi:hypothetical protein
MVENGKFIVIESKVTENCSETLATGKPFLNYIQIVAMIF